MRDLIQELLPGDPPKPLMAYPIDVPGALAASQQTGLVGPTPLWAPTQSNPLVFQALQAIQVDQPPWWYSVRYGDAAGFAWVTTQDPIATIQKLMQRRPTPGSFIEAYRFSRTGAYAKYGSPTTESGILYCRYTGSSSGWTYDFCWG